MTSIDRSSYGLGLTASARDKRNQQLASWNASATNREPSYVVPRRVSSRVKFSMDVIFMAAVASGDEEEVERLLEKEGAQVNCVNSDGLTPAHQCCIDDNLDMLKVLVEHGADVNTRDNEGWTPLHAAASCGYTHIVRFLLDYGAFPACVNNEGQTPKDLVEECEEEQDNYQEIMDMIQAEIDRLGINVEEVRSEEERVMLEDAKKLRNDPTISLVMSNSGASPLHVAASKNYITVLNVLLSIKGFDINPKDDDGWTPLHAAVYWGSMEAAELLVLSGANVYAKTNAGEDLDDLVEPELEEDLASLKKLNSYINPDQEQTKRRKTNPIPRHRPSFSHSNSVEGNKGFPSPSLKRRLSKEKLTLPKMDMKQEKEDLLHSFERVIEEPETSSLNNSKNTSEPTTCTTTTTTTTTTTSAQDSVSSNSSLDQNSPPLQRMNSGQSGSPKVNRKKGELSQKMMARLSMFESSGGGGAGSTSGGQSAPSPRTSTPIGSPAVLHHVNSSSSLERHIRTDGEEMRPRVSSMDPQSSIQSVRIKRFQFQSNPVSGNTGSANWKTMSLDRSDPMTSFIPAVGQLLPREAAPNSQPASAKANGEHPSPAVAESQKSKKEAELLSSSGLGASGSQAISTEVATPVEDNRMEDVNRSQSVESSSSSISRSSSNVSQTQKEAETKRKVVARRQRETRRPTQPVPVDLLKRINKHDAMVEKDLDSQQAGASLQPSPLQPSPLQPSPLQPSPLQPSPLQPSPGQGDANLNAAVEVKSPVQEQKSVEAVCKEQAHLPENAQSTLVQSAYQPKTRPTSKINNVPSTSPLVSVSQAEDSKAASSPVLAVDQNDSPLKANYELSPQTSRSGRSRRKPKEKRRSTGIPVEVDENEEIPEVLQGIVKRTISAAASSSSSGSSICSHDPSINSLPSELVAGSELDASSVSTTTVEYYQEEICRLKGLLDKEQAKSQSALQDYKAMCLQLKAKDEQIATVQSQYAELEKATRLESQKKDKQIQQLTKTQKEVQELKAEIQRLKDENGALIRVVGKLSRAPMLQ